MTLSPKIMFHRLATLLCWSAAIYLIVARHFWYLFLIMILIHVGELFLTAYRRGIKAGKSAGYTVLMTLIFGYAWWLFLDEQQIPDSKANV